MVDQMGGNRDAVGEGHRRGLGWWWWEPWKKCLFPGLRGGEVSLGPWP